MHSAMDDPQEILDLVDENDQPIGTIRRDEVPALISGAKTGMVRSSSVFIMNDAGKLWIPKRTAHKKIAPNGFDFSVGEHVVAGETYIQAAVRGLKEELRIEADEGSLQYIGKISNKTVGLPYFNALYLFHSNVAPDYNKDDFVSYKWLMPSELLDLLEKGVPAKKDMKLSVELLNKQ